MSEDDNTFRLALLWQASTVEYDWNQHQQNIQEMFATSENICFCDVLVFIYQH